MYVVIYALNLQLTLIDSEEKQACKEPGSCA